jgi:hypothetical protein
VDVLERADPKEHQRLLGGPHQPPAGLPGRDERQDDEGDGGRTDREDEPRAEPAVEPVVEDLLDEDRGHQGNDGVAERHENREAEPLPELGALPEPTGEHRPRPAEMGRDGEALLDRHRGRDRRHRSPRS